MTIFVTAEDATTESRIIYQREGVTGEICPYDITLLGEDLIERDEVAQAVGDRETYPERGDLPDR